jgi:hypothetical protein
MLKFLSRILAPQGYYCLVGLKKDAPPKQSFHETLEDVGFETKNLLFNNYDIYFACATFKESGKRTQVNAAWFKSFFLDIDCGDGKPYTNQAEALVALKAFCNTNKFPTPTLITSGSGVHVYWILSEAIEKTEWLPVAEKLKALCKDCNMEADAAITADTARILRIPETYNYKTDPPVYVCVLHEGPDIDFESFKDAINQKTTSYKPSEYSPLTQKLIENKKYSFSKIIKKMTTGESCNQLKIALLDQENADYRLWRGALSIAANCIDKKIAIHIVSKKHSKYNFEETETMAMGLHGKPYKCETFESYAPEPCETCKHKNKIKSPIVLGLEIQEKKEEKTVLNECPPLPHPYFRGAAGGIYRKSRDPNDDDILIYENDIFLIKRLNDKEKGDTALARFILPKDAPREFYIPLSVMRSKEELGKLLATQGILLMSKQLDAMMVYLMACTKQQQTQAEAEIMRVQFGWVDEDNKFILGDKEIGLKTIKYSPPSPSTESLCQWIQPKGDLEEWKKVISIYDQDNFEPHCFGLFTAFGAPLMKHLGFNGALINLINSSSGTGKSTILKVCNSVYGHPDKLLAQETDTFAHKMFRLGIMNNMPYTIDEVTNMDPATVSKLLYNVSQGTGPGRMQSQTNIERKNDTSWSLIALASANSSMAEKLSLLKQFADGELMRLLEYRIDQTDNINKSDAYNLFEGTMLHNYGLAGPPYIKWLVRNLKTAVELTRGMQETLDKKANLNAKERFWSAVISCNITGAHIAKTLNLIDIDVIRVLRWATNDLIPILRQQITEPEIDFISVLGGFLNINRGNILVVNGTADARVNLTPAPLVEPRFELSIRLEPDNKILYVSSKAIRKYCAEEQIIFKDLISDLDAKNIFKGTKRKRLATGTSIDSPPVETHIFDVATDDLIDTNQFIKNLEQQTDDDDDDSDTRNII